MEKKGGFFSVLGAILFILILLILGGAYYAYNYHVFKEIRVCVGTGVPSQITCEANQECLDFALENGMKITLENAPDFLTDNFYAIIDEAIYCDSVCHFSEIRGLDIENGGLLDLEYCEEAETEFLLQIRGSEGIEILKFMSSLREEN